MKEEMNWDALDASKFADEEALVADMLASSPLDPAARETVGRDAATLVASVRRAPRGGGIVESFLHEFSLGTREGLALMCLAEALLRTPDAPTRDRLIAEKVAMADWARHLGKADSLFVNASTWALMLTGKLVEVEPEARHDVTGYLRRLAARVGEPVIRQAVSAAMRMMGEQFILGRTIAGALERASREDLLCSFDMLGEGARTRKDADAFNNSYAQAIAAVGLARRESDFGTHARHGVSVKLSALHPRYEAAQEALVWEELYPRLRELAALAARHDVDLAVDAEEADRLVLSLKLIERLTSEPGLNDWQGLGVVVQAYQKRGRAVIERLAGLARARGGSLMVRLVKGAYWDSEIKAAQVAGMPDYPVFTTKVATDVSYLVCARALLDASPHLYPQFATHNAHTLVAVRRMAAERGVTIEHQRLHGMGEALYDAARDSFGAMQVRVYAPVGDQQHLLPYLVRRLLENGANSSFVHRLFDEGVPAEDIAADPFAVLEQGPRRHPRLRLPPELYGPARRNPLGRDLSQASVREQARSEARALPLLHAGPLVAGQETAGNPRPIASPADARRIVGEVVDSTPEHLDRAILHARRAQPDWDRSGGPARAAILRRMGDALEQATDRLVALLAAEAGKTFVDGVAEVREAVDFCRYYAVLAEEQFGVPLSLRGPAGESNRLELSARGTFACISPWNFPLAIFTGQIAAALAAGNAVIAKPAEQTPLIAAEAVRLFHGAGLDPALLALLPGPGNTIGAALIAHEGIDGVAFTGGTETAFAINRALAARQGPIMPFIAETGGLNAMFVDTTALREQVIDDVVTSAFGSSGQRCSALRMLFLPRESADELIEGLAGALMVRSLGDPADPATDIGPVIDAEARAALERHLARLEREARIVARHPGPVAALSEGCFFAPVIAEVTEPDFLEHEVFGPILHVCRYAPAQLAEFATRLAARRYGLTLGIHSRIEGFARDVQTLVPAGNVYVNRSMIGAVVGVQPFGGGGLSGTGPKAGGPHALLRYATERAVSVNIMAQGGDPALLAL